MYAIHELLRSGENSPPFLVAGVFSTGNGVGSPVSPSVLTP
jgi:hypothetical protein